MEKLKVALLASIIAFVSTGSAIADEIDSEVVTATADVIFTARGTASVTLTASDDLVAGPQTAGTQVATGLAEATESSVAIRWTPVSGTVTKENELSTIIQVKGKNNPTHIANFVLVPDDSAGQMSNGNDGWIVPTNEDTSKLNFTVQQHDTAVVAGDTYVLSVDAAVWAY